MAVVSAADRVSRARTLHQEAIHFASEFWDKSDLLLYLTEFLERLSGADANESGSGLEVGLAIRRMVTEKCLARWSVDEQVCFRRLSQALHRLHVNLHTSCGVVTAEVGAAAALVRQEIRVIRVIDSL